MGEQPDLTGIALDDARLDEVHALLRHESSISFQSWRAHESIWLLFAEVVRLRSVVAGVEALADEGVEVVLDDHWLTVDGNRRIVGCHCGFRAAPDDCGYGDSVLAHLADHSQRRLRSVLSDTKGEAQ